MSEELFIGVDAGTSVIKSAIFDAQGTQLAAVAEANRYAQLPSGGAEQDMAATWQCTLRTLADVVAQVPDCAGKIAAIAVTAQGDGTWLIDKNGAPVGDALLWLDVRAAGVVDEFAASGVRSEVYQHTGCGMNACNQSAQLIWLRRTAPERIAAAAAALHCKDWLYYNLTGQIVTDVSEGIFTFGDFRTRRYASQITDAIGLADRADLLPPIVDGSSETHPLSRQVAERCRLPAGIPVALGYVDVVCAALGSGVRSPHKDAGCSIIGSTGMHLRLYDDPQLLELPTEPSGYTMPFPEGFAVMRAQSNMAGTLNFDWLAKVIGEAAQLFGAQPPADTVQMLEAYAASAPGSVLFHPYIDEAGERGPFLNPQARAQFAGLSSSVGIAELIRAVYEGLAMAGRHCYEAIGTLPAEVRLTGGGGRSALFREIFASVLNVPTRATKRENSGAAGAAMMAGTAVGFFGDIAEACAKWSEPLLGEPQQPHRQWSSAYERLFPAYTAAAEAAAPVWAALAEARK